MERNTEADSYIDFPWPQRTNPDGTITEASYDLTQQPERLSEIYISAHSHNLHRLLEEVNLQEGLFMTLACDWQKRDDGICGFIDLAFRPGQSDEVKADTDTLDKHFMDYLTGQEAQNEMAQGSLTGFASALLDWSCSPVRIHGSYYDKVTVQYYCQQAEEVEWCLDHLRHFLVNWYPSRLSWISKQ